MLAIYKQMSQLLSSVSDASPDDVTALPQLAVVFTQAIWAYCGQRSLGMEFKFWLVEQPDMIFAYELPIVPDLSDESLDAVQQVMEVIKASAAPRNDDVMPAFQRLIQTKCEALVSKAGKASFVSVREEPIVSSRAETTETLLASDPQPHLAVPATSSTALAEPAYDINPSESHPLLVVPTTASTTLTEHDSESGDEDKRSQDPVILKPLDDVPEYESNIDDVLDSSVTVAIPVKIEAEESVEDVTGIPQELLEASDKIAAQIASRNDDENAMIELSLDSPKHSSSVNIATSRSSKRRRTMTKRMRESIDLGTVVLKNKTQESSDVPNKSPSSKTACKSDALAIAEAVENEKCLRVSIVKLEVGQDFDKTDSSYLPPVDESIQGSEEGQFFCFYCNEAFDMVKNDDDIALHSGFPTRLALRKHLAREHIVRTGQSLLLTCPMCAFNAASANGDDKQVCNRILRHVPAQHGLVFARGSSQNSQDSVENDESTQKKQLLLTAAAFRCIFCKIQDKTDSALLFASRLELRRHIQDQHVEMDEEGQLLACPICHTKTFRSKSMDVKQIVNRTLRHVEASHPDAMNDIFVMKEEVGSHNLPEIQATPTKRSRYERPPKGKYFCFDCTIAQNEATEEPSSIPCFPTEPKLEDHIASAHVRSDDEGPHVPCPVCSFRFNVIDMKAVRAVRAQIRHLREIHSVKMDSEESIRKASVFQKQNVLTKHKRQLSNASDSVNPDQENSFSVLTQGNSRRMKLSGTSFSPDGDKYYCVECIMNWDGKLCDEERQLEPFPVRIALLKHILSCHIVETKDTTPHLVCPVCLKSLPVKDINPLRSAMRLTRHLREIHIVGLWSEAGIEKLKQEWPTREAIVKSSLGNQEEYTAQDESRDPEDVRSWTCMMCKKSGDLCTNVLESRKKLEEHIVKNHCDTTQGSCQINCPSCEWSGIDAIESNIVATNFVEHCIISHNLLWKEVTPDSGTDLETTTENKQNVDMDTDIPLYCFMCPAGSFSFDSNESYRGHIRESHVKTVNEDESAITCSLCHFQLVRSKTVLDMPGPGDHITTCLLLHMVKSHGVRVPPHAQVYRCELCGWETLVMRRYEFHLRADHGKKMATKQPFRRTPANEQPKVQCGDCFKWMTAYSLSLHGRFCPAVARLTERRRRYFCNLCPKAYFQQHVLNAHVRTFHKKERNQLCSQCGTGCFNNNDLVRHAWIHHKVNLTSDPVIACAQCGEQVPPRLMNLHARLHRKKIFRCPTCGETQAGVRAYKKHLLTHEEHSIWKCDQCSYTCELRSGYAAVHMARAHNINRHECELCRYVTTTEEFLNKHKKVAHPEGDVKLHFCTLCRKQLSTRSAYQNHMFVRHQLNISKRPVLSCPICGFQTLGQTLLRAHMTKHKDLSYPCSKCGKLFKTRAICHEHYKRIHGEKKYTCDLCEFSTRTRGHLQRHVARLHRPESYTCPYCLFTTFMLARYQNHIRQKHGVGREKEEKILQKLMADKPDQLLLGKALGDEDPNDVGSPGVGVTDDDLDVFAKTAYVTTETVTSSVQVPGATRPHYNYSTNPVIVEIAEVRNEEGPSPMAVETDVTSPGYSTPATEAETVESMGANSGIDSVVPMVSTHCNVITGTMGSATDDTAKYATVTTPDIITANSLGIMKEMVKSESIAPAPEVVMAQPEVAMAQPEVAMAQSEVTLVQPEMAMAQPGPLTEEIILDSMATVSNMNKTSQNVIFIDSMGTVQNVMATDSMAPGAIIANPMAGTKTVATEAGFITLRPMGPNENIMTLGSAATPTELMAAETLEILSEITSADAMATDPNAMTSQTSESIRSESVVTMADIVTSEPTTSGLTIMPPHAVASVPAFTNQDMLTNMTFGLTDQPHTTFSSVDGAAVQYMSLPADAGPETVVFEEVIDPQPQVEGPLEGDPNIQYIYITQELPPH